MNFNPLLLQTRQESTTQKVDLDSVGTTASLACAVHCALMPVVVTFLPLIGLGFLANKATDWIIWVMIATVGIVSLGRGYRKHTNRGALILLSLGLLLLGLGHLTENKEHGLGLVAVLVGGLLVASSHWLNRSLCRAYTSCSCSACAYHPPSHPQAQ